MLWGGFEGYYNKVGLSGYDNYHKLSFENLRVSDEKINAMSDTIVEKGINKINSALSKQLRK